MSQAKPTLANGDLLQVAVEEDQAGFRRAYTLNAAGKRHGVCYEWDLYDRLFAISHWEDGVCILFTMIQ